MIKKQLKKRPAKAAKTAEKKYFRIINRVLDPELGVGVVDLGLIYKVTEKTPGRLSVTITLTSMGCPLGPQISGEIEKILMSQKGIRKVKVEIVWEPPWNPDMMKPEIRKILFSDNYGKFQSEINK